MNIGEMIAGQMNVGLLNATRLYAMFSYTIL